MKTHLRGFQTFDQGKWSIVGAREWTDLWQLWDALSAGPWDALSAGPWDALSVRLWDALSAWLWDALPMHLWEETEVRDRWSGLLSGKKKK